MMHVETAERQTENRVVIHSHFKNWLFLSMKNLIKCLCFIHVQRDVIDYCVESLVNE